MKKDKTLPYSFGVLLDPEWQWNEHLERQRIIEMLNKHDIVVPRERSCSRGEHYILINEFGIPQCSHCLAHMDWKIVKKDLLASTLTIEGARERYKELRSVSKKVIDGNPPKNTVNWSDYVYTQRKGYVYMERYFYERD